MATTKPGSLSTPPADATARGKRKAKPPEQRPSSFVGEADALKLPAPPAGGTSVWPYRHATVKGFYVYVSRPDAQGRVKREYGTRYDEVTPEGVKERKPRFGVVGLMRFDDALVAATSAMQRARVARKEGKAALPTLQEALDDYIVFKTQVVASEKRIRPATVEDYRRRMKELVPDSYLNSALDELTPKKWQTLRRDCTDAQRSYEVRHRPPVGEARFDGLLRGVVSGIYRRQMAMHRGLTNPVAQLREEGVLGTARKKHDFITLDRLAATMRYADAEMRGPQRDILLIGLLTGWRRELIHCIPLDRIDVATRSVLWRHTDRGGPYAADDGNEFRYPVADLLWEKVFAPRLEHRTKKQKFLIESTRKPGQPMQDVRDSFIMLDEVAGVHISSHVLRKTFLTLAPAAGVHQAVLSHLAMHKLSAGGSDQTRDYQKRDFSLMKDGANKWAWWFAEQVGWTSTATEPKPVDAVPADTVSKLQSLASLDPAQLDKLLKLVEALK